jgi:putative transposase
VEIMKLAVEYITRGIGISDVADLLHIPRCSFYRIESSENPPSKRGRDHSSFTLRKDGDEITILDNSIIANEIEKLISREFVCYGYKKTAKHLNRLGYIINRKKVRRLMS